MKIIEGLKKVKDLKRKADDLKELVREHCAITNVETPKYDNQADQVKSWMQAHSDIMKEISRLRIAIQKTNLETVVKIELGGKAVEKTIAEWIHRRRDLAREELVMWKQLSDRGLKEGYMKMPSGDTVETKIQRFYSPKERDEKVDLYGGEPMIIDARLEVINAITGLIGYGEETG
jgi:hypothetical protein